MSATSPPPWPRCGSVKPHWGNHLDMQDHAPPLPTVVVTVGHSNRSLEAFLPLLQAHSVTLVVDVRKRPRSRHNPL